MGEIKSKVLNTIKTVTLYGFHKCEIELHEGCYKRMLGGTNLVYEEKPRKKLVVRNADGKTTTLNPEKYHAEPSVNGQAVIIIERDEFRRAF